MTRSGIVVEHGADFPRPTRNVVTAESTLLVSPLSVPESVSWIVRTQLYPADQICRRYPLQTSEDRQPSLRRIMLWNVHQAAVSRQSTLRRSVADSSFSCFLVTHTRPHLFPYFLRSALPPTESPEHS